MWVLSKKKKLPNSAQRNKNKLVLSTFCTLGLKSEGLFGIFSFMRIIIIIINLKLEIIFVYMFPLTKERNCSCSSQITNRLQTVILFKEARPKG